MKNKTETFKSLMETFGMKRDLRTVFADFLALTICAFSQNPEIKMSYHEDEYLRIIGKYDKPKETDLFPQLLGTLIMEMEGLLQDNGHGPDVLGSFFELYVASDRKAQFFTPWPICMFMASITGDEKTDFPLSIIDPCCGSGRMLLAKSVTCGKHHHFYGIDIDPVCVQMAIINLFLNGIFHAEVMQANALIPNDFVVSYVTSFSPLGIFRITEREQSPLWHSLQASWRKEAPVPLETVFKVVSVNTDRGEQISMF